MKRPSNLVIGFILLIPSIFVFYALGRITLSLFKAPEVEIILEANANKITSNKSTTKI
jgi:hypothetical protein